jgi:hypothetical protein
MSGVMYSFFIIYGFESFAFAARFTPFGESRFGQRSIKYLTIPNYRPGKGLFTGLILFFQNIIPIFEDFSAIVARE